MCIYEVIVTCVCVCRGYPCGYRLMMIYDGCGLVMCHLAYIMVSNDNICCIDYTTVTTPNLREWFTTIEPRAEELKPIYIKRLVGMVLERFEDLECRSGSPTEFGDYYISHILRADF